MTKSTESAPVEVTQGDRTWLDEDTWASIPAYMHGHIERRAAHLRAVAEAPLRAEVERLSDLLDQERYKVAAALQTIARAVQGRKWLSEPGRGSYTYDDERYQAEFGDALDEIDVALAPMRKIASDWSDCPRDPLRVAANRTAALNPKDTDNG